MISVRGGFRAAFLGGWCSGSPKWRGEKLFPTYLKEVVFSLLGYFGSLVKNELTACACVCLVVYPLGRCVWFYACIVCFSQDGGWSPGSHTPSMTFAAELGTWPCNTRSRRRMPIVYSLSWNCCGWWALAALGSQAIFSTSMKGALQLRIFWGQCGHWNNANPSYLSYRGALSLFM